MSHDHNKPNLDTPSTDRREPDALDRFGRHWAVSAIMIGIVVYYLVTEHGAHFYAALPWLILLACPLLHIFMHGGHGGHKGHGDHDTSSDDHRDGDR